MAEESKGTTISGWVWKVIAGLALYNLTLYDFGEAVTVMPMPDFQNHSYLTSHAIFVIDRKSNRAMGIEIPSLSIDVDSLVDAVGKMFWSMSADITPDGRLPKPIKLHELLNAAAA